jgi:3-deoxy-8-phosphooctulonate synthase
VLLCRCQDPLPEEQRRKIALFTNVEERAVISAVDADDIYRIPILLHEQHLDAIVCDKLGIEAPPADLRDWQQVVAARQQHDATVNVAMVGKYVQIRDSYISLNEALRHAGLKSRTRVQIHYVESTDLEAAGTASLAGMDAILVPGGFGERGIEGKIAAVRHAREQGVPYLGICLGMQVAVIEFARGVLGLPGANSTEFERDAKDPVIALITEWRDRSGETLKRDDRSELGGTMRLGAQESRILSGTLARKVYGRDVIHERHRHRYEFNNNYLEAMQKAGFSISAFSEDGLVEIVELPGHPWFIGVQFHPEFTSNPRDGHPLFTSFVRERVKLAGSEIGPDRPLFLIAGPCVVESPQLTQDIAGELKEITGSLGIPFVFKASYDKANRSSRSSFRGPGIEQGLKVLADVRRQHGVPVLTDVHEDTPLGEVASVVDVLQTPAFLVRQTNFIVNVCSQGKPVNVKKGQFLSPWEMSNVVEKARSTGNDGIMVCERGFSFGYNNLVSDMRALAVMREFGAPVVFDATHSVQLPGGKGTASGGQREFVPVLARAAVAAGVAGIFMETHPDPDKALSDGPNAWPLPRMRELLTLLVELDRAVKARPFAEASL